MARREGRDGCAVETGPLADLVDGFVSAWNRQRPSTAGRFTARASVTVEPEPALSWLAAETGVPLTQIENIRRKRKPVTELRFADPIVMALERPEAFHDGTLRIRPNPTASRAARAGCCGGSTPSAAELIVQINGQFGPGSLVGA